MRDVDWLVRWVGDLQDAAWQSHLLQTGLMTAMPRVSIGPIVSEIGSCWTSRVNRVKACLPCRVRHAVSESCVCRVKETMSDMPTMSAVKGRKLGNQKILSYGWFKCGLL